jgi:hypothetical protein
MPPISTDLPSKGRQPNAYLVTLNHLEHGAIDFGYKSWRSRGVEVIAVSRFHERYEAMLLIRPEHWVTNSRLQEVVNVGTEEG